MGLDSFWCHPDWTNEDDEIDPDAVPVPEDDLALVGGIFSRQGTGSFRGKVYDAFIQSVTGESLYQHRIPNDTVEEMTNALAGVQHRIENHEADDFETALRDVVGEYWLGAPRFEGDNRDYFSPTDAEELADLVTMFEFYADQGATLEGWW